MPVPSGFGESTVDFIGARPDDGQAFAIEAKAHKKHPNDRQKKYIRDMRAAGWVVFIIDDERDGLKLNYQSCHELEAWLLEPWLIEIGV